MRNILTKFSVLFVFTLLLSVVTVPAQLTLRRALDMDGDNKADFSVFRPANAVWYILKTNGGMTFQQFGVSNVDYMTPGDYDGDGKGDISVWRDTDGVWYRLNSSTNTFTGIQFGVAGDEPVARDYDGDGKTDCALVRRGAGVMTWYILRSSNLSFFGAQFGASTDFTAPGDYDGDGKFDLAVQRPGTTATAQGIFYILKSTGGVSVVPWGFSNDLVVPGDYDGDNKTDIAVVREGALPTDPLTWFILKSTAGYTGAVQFGLSGSDINTQADYDGDGKTDIGVWRDRNSAGQPEGRFYWIPSSGTGPTAVQWGTASDFPIASYDTH